MPTQQAFSKSQSVALVTGGNSGIGAAIARALAAQGMRVVIAGRREAENKKVAKELESKFGVEALPVTADVSREEDCLSLIRESSSRWKRLDVLVNNAGVGAGGKIVDTTTETFDRVLRTNLYSAYWCSREAYRIMAEQAVDKGAGLRGAIINISSLCGVEAWSGSGIYSTSKHGMQALSKAMADEGAEDGIRVAAVCPALVSTPMTGVSGSDYIAPEDIASTVTYLLDLSPAAWPTEIVVNRRGAD
ncbi:MAG: SDR family NAD(P)-dependent oxidoreductase [Opitutales bacterium]